MAKPVTTGLPGEFFHTSLQLSNNVETIPFPSPTPLEAGVWITLDNRDFRVAFAPGVLPSGGGLSLSRRTNDVYFFQCADASLLRVASRGNNGRIAIMVG